MSGAVGYVRTSTVEQANTNNSLPVQTGKFQNFCVNSSLQQLQVFVDKQSARTANERPQFQEMLAYWHIAENTTRRFPALLFLTFPDSHGT
jgi:DNA invertase Pin-like site-specific DNA recombinase